MSRIYDCNPEHLKKIELQLNRPEITKNDKTYNVYTQIENVKFAMMIHILIFQI